VRYQFNYSVNFKIENTKILEEFEGKTFYDGYIRLHISQIFLQKVVPRQVERSDTI